MILNQFMKVLLCIDSLGPGGAQRQMVLLALELKKKGFYVDFFVYHRIDFFKSVLISNNINIIYIEKRNRIGLNILFGLRKVLINGKYDFAVSYLQTPNIYLTIASKLSSASTKIITSERATTNIGKGILSRVKYWCHLQSYAIVYNSFHEKNNWTQNFNALKKNSVTIYNGVDTAYFKPADENHTRTRKIIGVGTIKPDKNIHTFIKAIKILKDSGYTIEVNWYGKFNLSKEEKEYQEKLFELIDGFEIGDLWKWCEPSKEINKIMIQYDLMVLPSVREGLPNVVCEALACGLPVIVSNILDHPILVKEGVRGYLFEPNDPEELSLKIRKFYSLDSPSYNSMKKNCRLFAEKELNINNFINKYVSLFNGKKSELIASQSF